MKALFLYTFFIIAIAIQINLAYLGILVPVYIAIAASASSIFSFPVFAIITVIMSIICDTLSCGTNFSATLASIPFITSMFFLENRNESKRNSYFFTKLIYISLSFAIFNLFFSAQALYLHSSAFLNIIISVPLSIIISTVFFVCVETAKKMLYIKEKERVVFG